MTFRETSWPGNGSRTFIHLDGNDDLVIRNGLSSYEPGDKKTLEKWDWKIYRHEMKWLNFMEITCKTLDIQAYTS